MLQRRDLLKGVGAGSLVAASLRHKLAAAAAGKAPPKRVIFFIFDNGLAESPRELKGGTLPEGVPLKQERTVSIPLAGRGLPYDLQPFAPFQDRMTIVHGLRTAGQVDHGGGFFALAGMPGNKLVPLARSIDAAIAAASPGPIPLLPLGVGNQTVAYCCSAWGPGRPIGMMCKPEMAVEAVFGRPAAGRNEHGPRRDLFEFLAAEARGLRGGISGPEGELLEAHVEALGTLGTRSAALAAEFDKGTLARHVPRLPEKTDTLEAQVAAQCDVAAAALVAGLTNVVTICVGLANMQPHYSPVKYTGITNLHPHGIGHGGGDPAIGVKNGWDVLSMVHQAYARQAVRILDALRAVPEGDGTMFDNSLLVFASECANNQHCMPGANWPFVLVGDLGGRIKSGQFLSYPVSEGGASIGGGRDDKAFGLAGESNPLPNALYCSLLHAVGKPEDAFNRSPAARQAAAACGPLAELLT